MKKFVLLMVCALLCVYISFEVVYIAESAPLEMSFGHNSQPPGSPSTVPTGLDKHKAAFGPKIKEIQLGTPMSISDFMALTNKYLGKGSKYDGNWFLMAYNSISDIRDSATREKFVLYDSAKKQWKFKGNYPEYKQFLAKPRLVLAPGKLGFYNEINSAWCAIKAGNDFRIASFTLPFSAFGAKGIAPQHVAQEMSKSYGIRKFNTGGLLRGVFYSTDDADNYANGWAVFINGMDETITATVTNTSGGTSFN